MRKKDILRSLTLISIIEVLTSVPLYSQDKMGTSGQERSSGIILILLFLMVIVALLAAIYLYNKVKEIKESMRKKNADDVIRALLPGQFTITFLHLL